MSQLEIDCHGHTAVWEGHLECSVCKRAYAPGATPKTCYCGHQLRPESVEKISQGGYSGALLCSECFGRRQR